MSFVSWSQMTRGILRNERVLFEVIAWLGGCTWPSSLDVAIYILSYV